MRLILISVIVVAICHLESRAQFEFVPDSLQTQPTFRLDSLLEISFPTRSLKVEFEFRLWTRPSLIDYSDVFIMQLASGVWSAKYFEYQNGKFIQFKVEQKGLDSLWGKIQYNQVLALPNQESLRWLMRKYHADTTNVLDTDGEYSTSMMTDGTGYRFELFSKGKTRLYDYHCPASYLRSYPNIEALYRAYAILVLIRKHLRKPAIICQRRPLTLYWQKRAANYI